MNIYIYTHKNAPTKALYSFETGATSKFLKCNENV